LALVKREEDHLSLILKLHLCIQEVFILSAIIMSLGTDSLTNLDQAFNPSESRTTLTEWIGRPVTPVRCGMHSTNPALKDVSVKSPFSSREQSELHSLLNHLRSRDIKRLLCHAGHSPNISVIQKIKWTTFYEAATSAKIIARFLESSLKWVLLTHLQDHSDIIPSTTMCFSKFTPIVQLIVQGVPPGHEHLNIGRIKLHSSMTFI
jgi:hypothetical protein